MQAQGAETSKQVRDSNLLLLGRLVALFLNFAVQVLLVNNLTKGDFGVFAYALSIVNLGQALTTFGLDRGLSRFVPIYDEERKFPEMLGVLVMVFGCVTALGLAFILIIFGIRDWATAELVESSAQGVTAARVLIIMVLLAPVQAIDNLLIQTFAVFGNVKSIFFRRYLFAPVTRLVAVGSMIAAGGSVVVLSIGYVVAGFVGIVIYGPVMVKLIRKHAGMESMSLSAASIPWKTVMLFTMPLMTTDLLFMAQNSLDAIMVGNYLGADEVATLRAVQPLARMNTVVLQSFGMLFTPLAARYFARRDDEGINTLYWQTAIWVAVLSFPVFAVSVGMARPITDLLFGDEYRDSATVLALLGLGYYLHASLGFNGRALTVYGKVKYIVSSNVVIIGVNIGFNLLLIPRYGAIGAAGGTAITLIGHNLMKQTGLLFGTDVRMFDRTYLRVYATIFGSGSVLVISQAFFTPPFWLALTLVVLAILAVISVSRLYLNIGETYPKLLKFKAIRVVFGATESLQDNESLEASKKGGERD